jgi:hypothetical protein
LSWSNHKSRQEFDIWTEYLAWLNHGIKRILPLDLKQAHQDNEEIVDAVSCRRLLLYFLEAKPGLGKRWTSTSNTMACMTLP